MALTAIAWLYHPLSMRSDERNARAVIFALAVGLFIVMLALMVWFNADRFGGKGIENEPTPLEPRALMEAIFAALGLYFLVNGLLDAVYTGVAISLPEIRNAYPTHPRSSYWVQP